MVKTIIASSAKSLQIKQLPLHKAQFECKQISLHRKAHPDCSPSKSQIVVSLCFSVLAVNYDNLFTCSVKYRKKKVKVKKKCCFPFIKIYIPSVKFVRKMT